MVYFCPWIILVTVLAVSFVLGTASFGTFAMTDIVFTRGFSIFTHDCLLPLVSGLEIIDRPDNVIY